MFQVSDKNGTIEYLDHALGIVRSSPCLDLNAAETILGTITSSDSYIGRWLVRVYSMFLPRGSGRGMPELSTGDLSWVANLARNEFIANKALSDPRLINPSGVYYAPHIRQLREAIKGNDREATIRSLDDLRTALVWQ